MWWEVFTQLDEYLSELIIGALAAAGGWLGKNFKDNTTKQSMEVQTARQLIEAAMDLKSEVSSQHHQDAIDWENERQRRNERFQLLERQMAQMQEEHRKLKEEVEVLRLQLQEARVEWIKAFGDEPHWLTPFE